MRLGLLVPLAHAAVAQTITFPNTTSTVPVPAPTPPPVATHETTAPATTTLLRTVTPTPWSAAPTTDANIAVIEATHSLAPLSVTEAPPVMPSVRTRPPVALPSNPITAPIFKPQDSAATSAPSPANPSSMEPKEVGGGVLGVVGGVIAAIGLLGACIMLGLHAKHRMSTMTNEKSAIGSPPIMTPFDDAMEASVTRLESTLLGSQRSSQLMDAIHPRPSAIVELSPVQRSSLVFESSRGSIGVDATHRGSYGGVALRVPSLLDHPPETYEMRLSIMAARASEPAVDASGKPLPREMTF